MKIQRNIGTIDRIIRLLLGIALMLVAFLAMDAAEAAAGGIAAAALGALLSLTAATGYCAGYHIFHYSSIKKSK